MSQGSRRRAVAVIIASLVSVAGVGATTAHAQLLPPVSSTTTTTAPKASTTSTTAAATTTTTSRSPSVLPTTSTPGSTTTTTTAPPTPGEGAPPDPTQIPADIAAKVASVKRTAPNSTDALVAGLAPLGQYGLSPVQQALVGFGRFPVAGPAHWSDDWWLPRHDDDGTWRVHLGLDIFAAMGTPVRAPVDGVVAISNGGLGGLAVTVKQPNGTYWYMCHLSALAQGVTAGTPVKTGQVVGFVGDSGDAKGGAPHLHFEIHPNGGAAVPPKPVVDRFVADALAQVPQLVQAYADAARSGTAATAPAAPPLPDVSALTPRAALLWASAAEPGGGTLRLAESGALDAVGRIDWDAVADADRAARWAIAPLVPRRLAIAAGLYR